MGDEGRVGLVNPSRSTGPRVGPQVWAIAGGKGGAGRSFLAANMAHLLARDVGPVTLIDLDFEGANLHTFLGEQRSRYGIDAFLSGAVPELGGVVNRLAIPGLEFVPGPAEMSRNITRRDGTRLLSAIRRLETSRVLFDLPANPSQATLSIYCAADRPIIVVIPEPASVEGAHRFIKRVYVEVLQARLRAEHVPAAVRENFLHAAAFLPPERLLDRIERFQTGLGDAVHQDLEATTLYLIVNQVRHRSDEATGMSLKNAVQSYFGISVCHVGGVPYDEDVWLSARRRRLFTRDDQGDNLAMYLEQVVASLVEGSELAHVERALPRMQLL